MTAEQLEELLGKVTKEDWLVSKASDVEYWCRGEHFCVTPVFGSIDNECDATLIALAPSLARRVIAAEKLVEALDNYIGVISERNPTATTQMMSRHQLDNARATYREASK